MTRKDYVLAAGIVHDGRGVQLDGRSPAEIERTAQAIEDAFVLFFRSSGGRFDEDRFRAACK